MFAWISLIAAGLCEIGFTTCLKLSDNFSDHKWSLGFVIFTVLSFMLLNKATQSIPLGIAYVIWTGVGAIGTVIVGILFYKEPADFWRIFFILLMIASVAGLKCMSHE